MSKDQGEIYRVIEDISEENNLSISRHLRERGKNMKITISAEQKSFLFLRKKKKNTTNEVVKSETLYEEAKKTFLDLICVSDARKIKKEDFSILDWEMIEEKE